MPWLVIEARNHFYGTRAEEYVANVLIDGGVDLAQAGCNSIKE
jgi:hypothetical protein